MLRVPSSYIAMQLSSAPCPFIPPHPLSFPSPQCLQKEAENATTTCPLIVLGMSREPSGPAVPPILMSVLSLRYFKLLRKFISHVLPDPFFLLTIALSQHANFQIRPSNIASQSWRKKMVTSAPL